MRKGTLGSVCFILALVIVAARKWLASSQGIRLPLVGFVSPLLASFILVPLLLIPLTAINQRILAWRKRTAEILRPKRNMNSTMQTLSACAHGNRMNIRRPIESGIA